MADAFHLAGFEVSTVASRAGDLDLLLVVCPLMVLLPVLLGVGCHHAGSLLWGHWAGHLPRCGLCGWLQLRRCAGLCQRSVWRRLHAPFPHSLKRWLWLLLHGQDWLVTTTKPGRVLWFRRDQRSAEEFRIPDMRPLTSQGCTRLEDICLV